MAKSALPTHAKAPVNKKDAGKKSEAKKTIVGANDPWTVEQIYQWFHDNAVLGVSGVGDEPEKHFEQAVFDKHRKLLMKAIKDALDEQPFNDVAKAATKQVAYDIGRICRLVYLDEVEISEREFEAVRQFVRKNHHACLPKDKVVIQGPWCDY